MRRTLMLVLAGVLILSSPASAVLIPTLGITVEVVSEPRNPKPGAEVLLRANIIGGGPRTSVRFESGGAILAEGVFTLAVTAPARGKTREYVVTARTDSGVRGSATYILAPQDISLIYEGDSEMPPFLPLRPLANAHTQFTVLAVPDLVESGILVKSRDVYFEWRVNNAVRKDFSGLGRSLAKISPPLFNAPFRVSVVATSASGATAERTVLLSPRNPDVVFYESGPLSGVEVERAINSEFVFINEETTFIAYPLHVFNWRDLSYEWSLNNEPVFFDSEDQRTATFRKTGAGAGTNSVGFLYTHADRFFEDITRSFLIHF